MMKVCPARPALGCPRYGGVVPSVVGALYRAAEDRA